MTSQGLPRIDTFLFYLKFLYTFYIYLNSQEANNFAYHPKTPTKYKKKIKIYTILLRRVVLLEFILDQI